MSDMLKVWCHDIQGKWRRMDKPDTPIEFVYVDGLMEKGPVLIEYLDVLNQFHCKLSDWYMSDSAIRAACKDPDLVVLTEPRLKKLPDGKTACTEVVKELFGVESAQHATSADGHKYCDSCPPTLLSPPDLQWKYMSEVGIITACIFVKRKMQTVKSPQRVAWHVFEEYNIVIKHAVIVQGA